MEKKPISPLQYAAWAGDNFLAKYFIKFLPNELQVNASEQLREIIETAEHDYLSPYKNLIKAYNNYEELWHQPDNSTHEIFWIKEVGGAQRMLPVYGLQEFCSNKSFIPTPNFLIAPPRSFLTYSGSTIDLNLLGDRSALYKWYLPHGACPTPRLWPDGVTEEIAAIKKLCEVRSNELEAIINELLGPTAETSCCCVIL